MDPLTFKRDSFGVMKRTKKTERPLAPAVNGKAGAVLLDVVASVRRGLAQASKDAGRLADEVFDELEQEGSIR